MGAPDRFIAWCKQEQASIEQQLELLQEGKCGQARISALVGSIPPKNSIERAKGRLAELNDLLTQAGAATVIKPSAL